MNEALRPDVVQLCKALGHATRLELLRLLRGGPQCVCDLEASLDLPQSKVSYHLGLLRDAGLVTAEQRGKNVFYTLCVEQLQALGQQVLDAVNQPPQATQQKNSLC